MKKSKKPKKPRWVTVKKGFWCTDRKDWYAGMPSDRCDLEARVMVLWRPR